MKVCVVGAGGREHTLASVLGRTASVVVTPGNAGMAAAGVDCTPAPAESIDADLWVIGPEQPLVDGLADRLRAAGRLVFGPGADGAQLEGSKAWMKALVDEAGVPTARHAAFTTVEPAVEFLRTLPGLYVIKTDGLAAGKGVFVTESLDEAVEDVRAKLSGSSFGDAGRRVVIEEGMTGPELSLLVVCAGRDAVGLAPAQDFKRVENGDRGPNTGGMGAYSPVPIADKTVVDTVLDGFIAPTLAALSGRGIDYRGVLYAGLMLTPEGPKLVEFNVRFGDPETQVVLPRLDGDLAAMLAGAAHGTLSSGAAEARFVDEACVTVVCCAGNYPTGPLRTGVPISGLDAAGGVPGVTVFHAGTARPDDAGPLVVAGGRVLDVTALAPTIAEARDRAYQAVGHLSWDGLHYRTDIAAAAAKESL